MKLVIRNAVTEDLDTIIDLNLKLFENDSQFDDTLNPDWSKSEEAKGYYLERIQKTHGCAFVALVDEKIVGYLVGATGPFDFYRFESKVAELGDMFVLEDYRSQGVGSKLYQEFSDWAKDKKVDRLSVVASAGNQRAIAFYEKNGFEAHDVTLEKKI